MFSSSAMSLPFIGSDVEKDNLFTQAGFEPKLFYLKKWVHCKKSEFATKQHKWILQIGLPHINRVNNYVIINQFSFFKSKS